MSFRTAFLASVAALIPTAALATPATNGKFVNTDALNGKFVNGKFVNGKFVNTTLLASTSIDDGWIAPSKAGFSLGGTAVQGSGLAGWAYDWSAGAAAAWEWKAGTWYVDTDLTAQLIDPTTGDTELFPLHIDAIAPAEGDDDMLLHWVSVQTYDAYENPIAYPLCGYDSENRAIPSIMLRGAWSHDEGVAWGGDQISDSPYEITFACANGALGKCAADCTSAASCEDQGVPVALGYRRWAAPRWWAVEEGGGLTYHWRDYAMEHQACTRMIRADYCGDGVSHTENGTEIDVYDKMRDNKKDPAAPNASWFYEATWNEDGAVQKTCERVSRAPVSCGAIGVGALSPVALDYDAYPSAMSIPGITVGITYPLSCMTDDGMGDPAARMGNLRRDLVDAPLAWSIFDRQGE